MNIIPPDSAPAIVAAPLPAGTVIKVWHGYYWHFGIFDGINQVIHNSKKRGRIVEESLDGFIDGRKCFVAPEIASDDPWTAFQKAKRFLGQKYNLFGNNCEHFVRSVHGLSHESKQVQKYGIAGSMAYIAANVSGPSGRAALGVAAGAILSDGKNVPQDAFVGGVVVVVLGLIDMWLSKK